MLRQVGVVVATSSTICRHDLRRISVSTTLHGVIPPENRLLLPAENRFVASKIVLTGKHIYENRLLSTWIVDIPSAWCLFRPIFRRIGKRRPNWHETEGTDPRATEGNVRQRGQTLERRWGQTLRQAVLPFHNSPEHALLL